MTPMPSPRPLEMLTAADWALLEPRMRRLACRRGEVLLREGVRRRALVVVRSVMTHLAQGHPDQPSMVHLLDWPANHRSGSALRALFGQSAFAGRPLDLQLDAAQASWLAQGTKPV